MFIGLNWLFDNVYIRTQYFILILHRHTLRQWFNLIITMDVKHAFNQLARLRVGLYCFIYPRIM